MKHFLTIWKGLIIVLVFILCAGQVGRARAIFGIQAAIYAAADGDTITIPADNYYETLTVNKNIILTGASSSTTILHPAGTGHVIYVEGAYNLKLNSLEVTGGQASGTGAAGEGGGIYLAGGSLELASCLIDHNTAATYGGGVFQGGSSGAVTAIDTRIDHNTATNNSGGGLYVTGNAILTRVNLTNNVAHIHGGGMDVAGSSVHLGGGLVNNNQATTGNGGGVDLNNNLSIDGTQFNKNTAGASGGALTQWNSGMTVSITNHAVFNDNSAVNKGGGAYLGSHATLTGTTFSGNTVNSGGSGDTYGGGLYAPDGIEGSQLTFNTNAAQCVACANEYGGGLYLDRLATDTSSISSSAFDGNSAWEGGGIYSTANDQLTVTNSTFTNNNNFGIGYGGGIDASWLEGDHLLFQNNAASNRGGGVTMFGPLVLNDSRFIGNTATNEGGGAIAVWESTFNGTNLLFLQNNSNLGAALYVYGGTSEMDFATIARPANTNSNSAIVVGDSGILTLKDSIISSYGVGVGIGSSTLGSGTLTEDYNLFFNNTENFYVQPGSTLTQLGHSIANQDPRFVNPSAGDYHLLSSSPAIGAGTDLGVTTDLDGNARTGRWDIGAFQYWAFVYLPLILK